MLVDEAHAQYNLRTVPVMPAAGQPFEVVIDDSPCEDFLTAAPGLPPTFTVEGNVASLTVDRERGACRCSRAVAITLRIDQSTARNCTTRDTSTDAIAASLSDTLFIAASEAGVANGARLTDR
jgi:hypothetical protein